MRNNRAIVIGASMAGLFAARVLADYFDDVLLVERDDLGAGDEHRRGIPQARHSHVLLAGGCRVIEALFPGVSAELVTNGATVGDAARAVRWCVEGGRFVRFTSDVRGFGMSRPLFERVVRARVSALANVRIRDGSGVSALEMSGDKGRVIGVALERETIGAGFVVDAGGRGSRTPQWLSEHGYELPEQERVEIELRYTTRLFRRRPGDLQGDTAAIVPPTPRGKRGGAIVALEDARWIVTLVTHFGEAPPADLAGFVEFTRTLPDPSLYEVVCDAEPIDEARTIRVPASVRHRYERLQRFPAGYVVIGDAIASFNPVYGQGMSVAALEAAELARVLRAGRRDLARHFFPRAAKIVDAAWTIAAGNDLRMPEAVGRRDAATTFANAYVPKLLRAGHHDSGAAEAFLKVSNMLAPPVTLLAPALVWRALRGAAAAPRPSR